MKRFSEQLHNKALSVKLTASERRDLRERISAYMEYHPLPQRAVAAPAPAPASSLLADPFTVVRFSHWHFARWTGAAVCLLVVSTAYMAEYARPGDVLYAVKVNVNEEVRAGLAFTPYEKITWETERLNRRIAEARSLASAGLLTVQVEEEVAAAVRTHGANARRGIEALKLTDSDEAGLATIHLATALDVHSATLRMGKEKDEGVSVAATSMVADAKENTNPLASAIDAARKEMTVSGSTTLPAYERMLAHVERDTTRARELLSSIEKVAADWEIKNIARRLEDVDRSLARALAVAPEDTDRAQHMLLDILQRTQKLIIFMTNIDVRATMDVNDIVPVELTDEERIAVIEETLAAMDGAVAQLEVALSSEAADDLNAGVLEKVVVALQYIEDLQKVIETALAEGALDEAERASVEGFALAQDAMLLVGFDAGGLVIEPAPGDEIATSTSDVPAIVGTSTATSTETSTSTNETPTSTDSVEI